MARTSLPAHSVIGTFPFQNARQRTAGIRLSSPAASSTTKCQTVYPMARGTEQGYLRSAATRAESLHLRHDEDRDSMNQGAGAVQCCIAGGGPAGMMLGLLLARAGVTVLVLEKHADFLRDFRGDTIHPSTLDVVHELGLLDDLLKLPHQEVRELAIKIGEVTVPFADFGHLPTR